MYDSRAEEGRKRLIELGGRTSQDLGMGRIVGQVLASLYFREEAASLDEIVDDLGLSKAAVSTAARQLESMGFLRRVWKKGDRRSYYRTADNIVDALQDGMLGLIRQKAKTVVDELEHISALLGGEGREPGGDGDQAFVLGRVRRAKRLGSQAIELLDSPLAVLFGSEELPR